MKKKIFAFLTLAVFALPAMAERIHTVRAGETLSSIARQELGAQARWKEIAALNGLTEPYRLRAGAELKLPGADSRPPVAVEAPAPAAPPARVHDDKLLPLILATGHDIPAETALPRGSIVIHSVHEAERLAKERLAEFRALALEVQAARAQLASAGLAGWHNPEVEGEVGRRDAPTQGGPGRERSTDWGVGVRQEFEIAGQAPMRRSVAQLDLERTIAASEARERDLLTSVHSGYIEALDGIHELILARQYERILKWLHGAAQERFEYGEISGVEARLAQVEAARATADRLNAERNAAGSLGRLAARIGLEAGTPLHLHDDHPMPQDFPDATPERALRERRDLRVLRLDAKLGESRSRLALAEGRPNVTVGAAYEREEESTDIYKVKFGIPLPLFNPRRGDADRARFEGRAADERVKALEIAIAQEVSVAKNELEILEARVRVLHDTSLAKSEENLSLVAEAFQEGTLGLTDVIVYFTEAQNARRAAHEALIDWGKAVVELERAVGAPLSIEEKELH